MRHFFKTLFNPIIYSIVGSFNIPLARRKAWNIILCFGLFFIGCKEKPVDVVTAGEINGKITNAEDGSPVTSAAVSTSPTTVSINTNSTGDFSISNVDPGQYTVQAQATGFASNNADVTVVAGQAASANISLTPISCELTVSPTVLNFGTASSVLQMNIANSTGAGSLSWTITKPADATWLSLSTMGGETTTSPSSVILTVNRSGLSPNNYSTVLTINSNGGDATVNVLMSVQNPDAPQLSVSTNMLDFGTTATTRMINVSNTGTGELSFQINSNQSWLTVSPVSGTIQANVSTITITVSRQGLEAGSVNVGSLSITSNGGSSVLSVTMGVEEGGAIEAPLLDVGSITESGCLLAWTECTESSRFKSYKVYSAENPGVTENSELLTTITNVTEHSCQISGISGPVTKYYKVYVYDQSGTGTPSNEMSVDFPAALKTWTKVKTFPNRRLYDIFSLDDDHAWLCCDSSIYKWSGSGWVEDYNHNEAIGAVYFVSNNEGYAITQKKVLKYNGALWQAIAELPLMGTTPRIGEYGVYSISSDRLIVNQSGKLYHYNDGNFEDMGIDGIVDMGFYSANQGFAYQWEGEDWSVLKYNGFGCSELHTATVRYAQNKDLTSLSDGSVWALSDADSLVVIDQSVNKETRKIGCGHSIYCLFALSNSDVWAGGWSNSSKICHYNGNTWKEVSISGNHVIQKIYMHDQSSGWAISDEEVFMYR